MKLLNPVEAMKIINPKGDFFSFENSEYRRAVSWQPEEFSNQPRVARSINLNLSRVPNLILALFDWISNNHQLIIWVEHFKKTYPSTLQIVFDCLIGGISERELIEKPAIIIDVPEGGVWDADLTGSKRLVQDLETAVLLVQLSISSEWNVKLYSPNRTDVLELWEGNVIFNCGSSDSRQEALQICDTFDLRSKMQ